jgi:carboxyl-terminal processing protease
MMRARVVFLSTSLVVVLLFTSLVVASKDSKDGLFRALGNLAEVVHLVRSEYVDELHPDALRLSLDAGIVQSIDRQSAVLGADEVDAFRDYVNSPPPFGLMLSGRLSSAAVRFAIPGSPAAEAGLELWEVIERVDGVYTRGRPLWQLRLELRAREQAGRTVSLTVLDDRVEDRREVVLEPAEWVAEPLAIEDRDGVMVFRVNGLPGGTAERFAASIDPESRVVLDLRDLVWGDEEEAIAVADLFIASGVLGGWRGRRAGSRTYQAAADAAVSLPPTVLVGSHTEGVGEIMAAALQRGGATIVGGRTIGHAPHMRMISDGDINLWMPVGQWLRADEQPISGNGIEPDEVVEESPDGEGGDPVLDRALELIDQPLEQAA